MMVLGLFSEHLRAVGFPIDGLLRGQEGSLSGSKTVSDNVGWGFWGNLLEQGFRRASVWSAYADALGYCWRNAVNSYGRGDALGFHAGAKEDDGEGNESGTRGECLLRVFVQQLPTWSYLDDDVAAKGGAEAVAKLQDVVVAS